MMKCDDRRTTHNLIDQLTSSPTIETAALQLPTHTGVPVMQTSPTDSTYELLTLSA